MREMARANGSELGKSESWGWIWTGSGGRGAVACHEHQEESLRNLNIRLSQICTYDT